MAAVPGGNCEKKRKMAGFRLHGEEQRDHDLAISDGTNSHKTGSASRISVDFLHS